GRRSEEHRREEVGPGVSEQLEAYAGGAEEEVGAEDFPEVLRHIAVAPALVLPRLHEGQQPAGLLPAPGQGQQELDRRAVAAAEVVASERPGGQAAVPGAGQVLLEPG